MHDNSSQRINKKWNRFFLISSFLTLVCFAGILALCIAKGGIYQFEYMTMQPQNSLSRWSVLDENGNISGEIEFPTDYECSENESLLISTILPDMPASSETTLKLQFLHMKVTVYMDQNIIYKYGEGELPFSHTPARTIHFIDLPDNSAGHEIRILLTPCLSGTQSYRISLPEIGNHFSLLGKLFRQEGMAFSGAFVLIFTGICISIFGLFIKKMAFSSQAIFLGMFSLLSGVFSLCETELALLLTGNPYLIHTGDAVALILVCLPFLGLLSINCRDYLPHAVKGLSFVILGSFVIQNILNFLGWDYRYFVTVSHISLILSIIILITIFFMSLRVKDKNTVFYILTYLPIVLGAVLELLNFYITAFPLQGFFFEAGIFLFIILQLRELCCTLIKNYQEAAVSHIYRELAFTDNMTGLPNRTAYQKKIDTLCRYNATVPKNTWCIMADINQLKMVNDTMGHQKGDALIIGTAEALKSSFGSGGDIFRIGGDEFAVIVTDTTENQVNEMVTAFRENLKVQEKANDFPMKAAVGYAIYDPETDKNLEQTFIRADNKMYENKKNGI